MAVMRDLPATLSVNVSPIQPLLQQRLQHQVQLLNLWSQPFLLRQHTVRSSPRSPVEIHCSMRAKGATPLLSMLQDAPLDNHVLTVSALVVETVSLMTLPAKSASLTSTAPLACRV